jgi:tryptophan-rich sensory protein
LLTFPLFGLLAAYHVFVGRTLTLKRTLWLLIPALAHGGIVVYQFALIQGHPIWSNFTAQNNTLSPPPLLYLFGYLPFLIPIVAAIRPLWRKVRDDERWSLPILWVVLVIVLLYAPFPTQRRYLLGVQTPLAVLATFGWIHGITQKRERLARLILIPYLALSMIAPLLLILANTGALSSPENSKSVFYTADELETAAWIREIVPPDALILTTFEPGVRGTGGLVVALTGQRVFSGHWIETADFDEKKARLHTFYNTNTADSERRDFLTEKGADYIWYDDEARTFGDWHPQEAD